MTGPWCQPQRYRKLIMNRGGHLWEQDAKEAHRLTKCQGNSSRPGGSGQGLGPAPLQLQLPAQEGPSWGVGRVGEPQGTCHATETLTPEGQGAPRAVFVFPPDFFPTGQRCQFILFLQTLLLVFALAFSSLFTPQGEEVE